MHAVLAQQTDHAVPAAGATARDQDPQAALLQPVDVIAHVLEQRPAALRALGNEVPPVAGAGVCSVFRLHEGRAVHDRAVRKQPRPFVRVEKERRGRDRVIGHIRDRRGRRVRARVEEIRNRLEAVVARFHPAMVEQDRALRHVVEERLQSIVEQRQPVLDTGIAARGGDRLVERVVPGHGAERASVSGAEARDRLRRQQHLADRRKGEGARRLVAPLRQRVEPAHGLDDVAKEIEPHRALGVGGEDIHDAAAHGVIAGLHHRAGADEPVALQVAEQRLGIERGAGFERQGRVGQHRAWRHPLEGGVDGGEHDLGSRRAIAQQPDETGEPPARDIGARRDPVVRQAIPGRNGDLSAVRIEESQHRGKTREPGVVAGDVKHRRCLRLREPEQNRRGEAFGNPTKSRLPRLG